MRNGRRAGRRLALSPSERIADHVSLAIAIQVGIADAAFLIYGFWNGWKIPGSTIFAWLSATVIQVIAVGLAVTKSLFPSAPAATARPPEPQG